ncbi:hypothetical protein Lal_00022882 [Lupinus albus]|nr:hypothetical protein Lal_00022882 [Lupinus albus]
MHSSDSVNYQNNFRLYNMMFAFTSVGAKFDRSLNNGRGPPTIRIQGKPCHTLGVSLEREKCRLGERGSPRRVKSWAILKDSRLSENCLS